MNLHVLTLDQWKVMSKHAHAIAFQEDQDPESLTCSYVLLLTDKEDTPVAYATILEITKNNAYMQHGGGMPGSKGTPRMLLAHQTVMKFLKEKYGRISTRIRNTNIPMIKISLANGLLIRGVEAYATEVFLTLIWEAEGYV